MLLVGANSATASTARHVFSGSVVLSTSICLYTPVLILSVLIFELLRRRKSHVFEVENHCSMSAYARKRWFAWIPFVLRVSDNQIFEKCGLDALVFLRFVRIGQRIALLSMLLALFLLPLFVTSNTAVALGGVPANTHPDSDPNPTASESDDDSQMDILDRITIANVDVADWRIAIVVVAGYVMSLYVMQLLWDEYKHFVKRRHQFLSRAEPQQYSVVVNDMPRALCRPQTLTTYMEYLFPNSVHGVYIGVECGDLEDLIKERDNVRHRLETARFLLEESVRKHGAEAQRPMHSVSDGSKTICCHREQQVDSIVFYEQELQRLDELISRERHAIVVKQNDVFRPPAQTRYGAFDEMKYPSLRQLELQDLDSKLFSSPKASESIFDPWERFFASRRQRHSYNHRSNSGCKSKSTEQQALTESARPILRNCAFVSFRNLRSAHAAQQLLQTESPITLRILPAPHVRDIIWENLGLAHTDRCVWGLVASLITFLIVCFWTFPTAMLTSLFNAEKLRANSPFWDQLFDHHSWVQNAVQQAAPLAIVSMNVLANVLFRMLATREGYLSGTEIEASHFSKLCTFQVFQMFLVSAVTGSLLNELIAIVNKPKLVLFLLGSSIANQSTLFVTFIVVQICVDHPLMLLRVIPLSLDAFHRIFAPLHYKTPHKRAWMGILPLQHENDLDFAYSLAQHCLVLLFVVVFCPIAPLVGFVGWVFFALSELVYKRYFCFVYSSSRVTVNSMGVFWFPLFNFTVAALFIAQFTLIGLVSLKSGGWLMVFASAMLPCCTFLFYVYAMTLYGFPKAAENLPLDQCCDLDEERKEHSLEFLEGVYQQPAMRKAYALSSSSELEPQHDVM